MSSIQCPTLLIVADKGNAELQQRLPRRRESVPHLREVTLEGGHHIHIDDPSAVVPVILDFLPLPSHKLPAAERATA